MLNFRNGRQPLLTNPFSFMEHGRWEKLCLYETLEKVSNIISKSIWNKYLDRNATSEIEYVIAKSATCVPLEVKSGITGKMKSLRVFLNKKKQREGLRTSLENFGTLTIKEKETETNGEEKYVERTIGIIPIYAIWNLPSLTLP